MNTKAKPKSGISRLLSLASAHRGLVITSIVLSSLSYLASFIPYLALFRAVRELLSPPPHLSALHIPRNAGYGWLAVIAHRLRTITQVDRVIVFDVGRIVEQGTQRGLMARDGLYGQLYAIQQHSLGWSVSA